MQEVGWPPFRRAKRRTIVTRDSSETFPCCASQWQGFRSCILLQERNAISNIKRRFIWIRFPSANKWYYFYEALGRVLRRAGLGCREPSPVSHRYIEHQNRTGLGPYGLPSRARGILCPSPGAVGPGFRSAE